MPMVHITSVPCGKSDTRKGNLTVDNIEWESPCLFMFQEARISRLSPGKGRIVCYNRAYSPDKESCGEI